jgi:hypothetical protein
LLGLEETHPRKMELVLIYNSESEQSNKNVDDDDDANDDSV